MTIEFVRLAPEDSEAISERIHRWWILIYAGEISSGAAGIDDIFNREQRPEHIRGYMEDGTVYESVIVDGEDMGMIAYRPVAPQLYVDKLYLETSVRRHGVGSACMEHMFGVARSNGCTSAALVASEHNEPAMNFYAKNGFVRTGSEPVYDHLGNVGYRIHLERGL